MPPPLRPYQLSIVRAVADSIRQRAGITFTVEIARQGGKNELSAQLELWLLLRNVETGGAAVKCAPTFVPQCLISIDRLKTRLDETLHRGRWNVEHGHTVRLGHARQSFLSAAPTANVVGATADLLLEVDEAQDVDAEKYQKEFRPMAAPANSTTVLYGTPWDSLTLLEEQKQRNLDLESKDGIRRHFRFDWQAVAHYNPAYKAFVESERVRLGEDHPLFKTQYALQTLEAGLGFLTAQQRAWLQGHHPRQHARITDNEIIVAAIDLAGESDALLENSPDPDYQVRRQQPGRDSTVVTIARLLFPSVGQAPSPVRGGGSVLLSPLAGESQRGGYPGGGGPRLPPPSMGAGDSVGQAPSPVRGGGVALPLILGPTIEILDHLWLTGTNHAGLIPILANLLKNTWHCRTVVIDATGLGAPIASLLTRLLGARTVRPFTFTAQSKSRLGFNLLAAVNANRLKLYAPDGSPQYYEFHRQLDHAQVRYRPNRTMDFFVDPKNGHDDFISSLAPLVEAASLYQPRIARGNSVLPS